MSSLLLRPFRQRCEAFWQGQSRGFVRNRLVGVPLAAAGDRVAGPLDDFGGVPVRTTVDRRPSARSEDHALSDAHWLSAENGWPEPHVLTGGRQKWHTLTPFRQKYVTGLPFRATRLGFDRAPGRRCALPTGLICCAPSGQVLSQKLLHSAESGVLGRQKVRNSN